MPRRVDIAFGPTADHGNLSFELSSGDTKMANSTEKKATQDESSQVATANVAVQTAENKEGKYLTFALGREEYGLEILKVREIIGYMEITAVPQTPHEVKGVINLRGQVIPVVDLRALFGMETADVTEETCIIVVEIEQQDHAFSTGIVVDHVREVLDIPYQDIEAAPQFGSSVNTSFILGMGKIGDSVKILLDIDKVLAGEDLIRLAATADGDTSMN